MDQIGVMSRNREYFPTAQLLTELSRRKDLSGIFLATQVISPLITSDLVDTLFAGQSLQTIAGIIPRIGRSQTDLGMVCLKHFELMGLPTTLSSNALFLARDKFRCFQSLKSIPGIQLPRTLLINHTYAFKRVINSFKFPIVIKIPNATRGAGTILAHNSRVAQEIIDALFLRFESPVIVQEFIRSGRGVNKQEAMDVRVLIIGDNILGAMARTAQKGEWRTNYALGAVCTPYTLNAEDEELIRKIIDTIEVEVAGIDIFPTNEGSYILEVNACPGWKAFEFAHPNIQVAKHIVDYLLKKIRS
ncbi:MAG: RimK family alpha-L-glutamate ligase [Candidatus Heimdallarchaeota archaeon]|nr:RimK family alpha-L-glutamate ligase [Candidatus Heimdallarchaeota archaeon]